VSSKANQPARPRRTVKSTVIEPFKQMKLGVYVMGITFCFVAIAGYTFVAAYTKQYQEVMTIFEIVDPVMQHELVTDKIFMENAIKLSVIFISFIAILFWVVLNITHKYYGPLVSIERFVDEISAGRYDRRVKIRRGDELERLVSKLNQMADQLQARHGRRGPTSPIGPDEDDAEAPSEVDRAV